MAQSRTVHGPLKARPVTPDRWRDLVRLFGSRGACGGCWCMLYKQTRSQFERMKGAGNRRALKRFIDSGRVPGLLGYIGREPVAWCAVEPRASYPSLERSRILKPVDARPVWSVVCFFVAKPWRRSGVATAILDAAANYVRRRGGRIIEGYPVAPKKDPMPDVFACIGIASAFRRVGFQEVARRSPTRPIMRRHL
jgi:GNAT superfamily N-acetyltransferase